MMYTDPNGQWFGIDDLIVAGFSFIVGYVSHGLSTGDWGGDALAAGGISDGAAWLTYNTAGMASGLLADAGLGQGMANLIGNGIGSSIGSFAGNIGGQAYFTGSIDWGQAGKSALYGFGHGVGSTASDLAIGGMRFPVHHTVKHIARSTLGEVAGSALTGDWGNMTFGLNPGLFLPVVSDVASYASRGAVSRMANRKVDGMMDKARSKGVGLTGDLDIDAQLDYGYVDDSPITIKDGVWDHSFIGKDDVTLYAKMTAKGQISLEGLNIGKL